MFIQKAHPDEASYIFRVYHVAQAFMRFNGNPLQWGDTYPNAYAVSSDIEKGILYTVYNSGNIVGACVFLEGNDPTYEKIDGAWCSDAPYIAIHKVASDRTCPGVMDEIIKYARRRKCDIRIDTHHDNKAMLHILESRGFTRCGIIHLENGDPRIAFQYCYEH